MIYDIYCFHTVKGESPSEKWLIGTIEERHLDELTKYLVEDCDYIEEEPRRKYSIHTIDRYLSSEVASVESDVYQVMFEDIVKFIEICESEDLGFIRPDNFDRVEVPTNSPFGLSALYRRVKKGFWVDNEFKDDDKIIKE